MSKGMDVSKLRVLSMFYTIAAMLRESVRMNEGRGGGYMRPGDFYTHGSKTFKKNKRRGI